MRILMISLGIVLMLAALWGGSYAYGMFGLDDWRQFPSLFTAALAFLGGFIVVVKGSQ